MTCMWQEEKGKPYYRIQTDDIEIRNIIRRRKKFDLIGWGDNCQLWIYKTTFSRPDIARKIFKSITCKNAILDKNKDIYYSDM